MRIITKTPTKAYLYDFTEKDIEFLTKELSFKYTDVSFMIRKHYGNSWLKKKSHTAWNEKLKELKEQENGCILSKDESGYYIRPGYIPYLKNKYEVTNEIEYPKLTELEWHKAPEHTPYDYQKYSTKLLLEEKHGAVSLPTGTGKTLIIQLLIKNSNLKTVVITPSKAIFLELYDSFVQVFGEKNVGRFGDGDKDIDQKITIAIGKSLAVLKPGSKEEKFFKEKEMIVVDESHTWATDSLEAVCHGVLQDAPYRFYLSATQIRNNGTKKVLNSIIGKIVYEMSLQDAMQKGYLCPLKFNIVKIKSKSKNKSTDPITVKREHFLRNVIIGDFIAKMCNGICSLRNQSCLVLVEELDQIACLKERLKVPFAYIHGDPGTKCREVGLEKIDLKKELERFNKGEAKVLIGTRSISTGTNIFPTHHVFNWVGGSSEIVTKQGTMGRSTRKLENSKYKDLHTVKAFSNIYDFDVDYEFYGKDKDDDRDSDMLFSQLEKRIEFYKETGETINFIDN